MKKNFILFGIYITLKIILYNCILFSLVLFENEQKEQIATTSTQLIRENYLFTDFRNVKKDLAKIKEENFSQIDVLDSSNNKIISLTGEENFPTIKIQKRIWSDSEKKHLKGIFIYSYSIKNLFLIALKPFLLSFLITLPIFLFAIRKIEQRELERVEHEKSKALNRASLQISHDIRSPIATLQQILHNNNNFTKDEKKLFTESLQRINNIANSHLNKSKDEEKSIFILNNLLVKIIFEKKLEYPDLEIESSLENYWIEFPFDDLARIISNLINNSYESMSNQKKVIISSKKDERNTYLIIRDFGHGIPASILASIGKKEITSKPYGNGLGLMHASTTLRKWNSSLKVVQTSESGTIIQLTFPTINPQFYLIDNDELVCLTWETRAKDKNISFNYSLTKDDFFEKIKQAPKNAFIYIDSELGNNIKGEDIAQELHRKGFYNLHLTTGHEKERFNHLSFLRSVLSKTPPF